MTGNILIVDDTTTDLTLLTDILTKAGYLVHPFDNTEAALAALEKISPELLLTALRLPAPDGLEVCRRIRQDPRLKDIPVIFTGSAADAEGKAEAFDAGGVDYIGKPLQNNEVLSRVQIHLALYHSRQELERAEETFRKSTEGLKIAQAMAHVGHMEFNVNSWAVIWSDETYRIFGYEPNSITPSYDALLAAVHPKDREYVASHISGAQQGSSFDIEFRIVLPDGRVRVIHGIGVLLFLGDYRHPEIIGAARHAGEREHGDMVGVVQDITERKEMEWRLEQEARTDALTGCSLRRYFMEVARRELGRIRRYGGKMSLLMLDLDYFKTVNDGYGHLVGDRALQKLVQVCRDALRQEDMIGRLGGEEFAILLIEAESDKAFEVAERIRQAVASTEIPLEMKPPLQFTVSIGVAGLIETDSSIEEIINRADQALYAAKRSGRNRVSRMAAVTG